MLPVDHRTAPIGVVEQYPAKVPGRERSAAENKAVFVTEHSGRARWMTLAGWSVALLAAAWMVALGAGIPGFLRLPGVKPGALLTQRHRSAPREFGLVASGHRPSAVGRARAGSAHGSGADPGAARVVANPEMVDYRASAPDAPDAPDSSAHAPRAVPPPRPRSARRSARRTRPMRPERGAPRRPSRRPRLGGRLRGERLRAPARRPGPRLA